VAQREYRAVSSIVLMTSGTDQRRNPQSQPLVTVGIPTFNRPERLRRTLESVTAQTYRHLEIIVSDNASPDPNVSAIAQDFASQDDRIRVFHQEANLGAHSNFRFVLGRATGPYFMWWADDDERTVDAIEFYVASIGDAGGCFSTFAVRDHAAMTDVEMQPPLLSGRPQMKGDISRFIEQMSPAMFYGLLRTDSARSCWSDVQYDWLDCHIILRLIATHGYKTLQSEPKFFAGQYGRYVPKPANGKVLNPWPYFFRTLPLAFRGGASGVRSHCKFLKQALRFRRAVRQSSGD
jgi:glycosyltransferase involved in cell wall biosynthesis